MDGVGISIIERPRPLPGHDTPNPTEHPYTLKCEEPDMAAIAGLDAGASLFFDHETIGTVDFFTDLIAQRRNNS